MTKLNNILFIIFMMIGTLIAISSISWMNMWIGLELNLLSIIPLMNNYKNLYSSESSLKYFLTQVLASMIILFSIIMLMLTNEFMFINYTPLMNMLLNSALFMKMGMAPFHFWFPEILEGLSWMNCLIMLTWQKISPMILLMYNCNLINFMTIIIMISIFTGSIMGLNQLSLRKILAYSSITHMGWMTSSFLISQFIWFLYFIIYSLISINIILMLNKFNLYFLYQISNLNLNMNLKITFMMNFMSMGGLPPFLGFLPKWMVLNFLIKNNFLMLSMMLIMSSMITLYFYIRLMYSSLVFSNLNLNFKFSMNKFNIYILNFMNLMGIWWMILIFNLT